jgi:VanZ family protein
MSDAALSGQRSATLWLVRVGALLATAATLWLAFKPAGDAPGLIPWDKAGHFLSFYVLTILYTLAAPRVSRWGIIALLVVAGATIEIVQGQVGRDADVMDWLADMVGIGFVALPVWLEALRRRIRA